jgi:hypothetical protein
MLDAQRESNRNFLAILTSTWSLSMIQKKNGRSYSLGPGRDWYVNL